MRLIHVGLVAATMFGMAEVAQAHPNHASEIVPATSAWHYLLQPEHIAVPLLVAIVAFVGLARMVAKSRQSKFQPARVHHHR